MNKTYVVCDLGKSCMNLWKHRNACQFACNLQPCKPFNEISHVSRPITQLTQLIFQPCKLQLKRLNNGQPLETLVRITLSNELALGLRAPSRQRSPSASSNYNKDNPGGVIDINNLSENQVSNFCVTFCHTVKMRIAMYLFFCRPHFTQGNMTMQQQCNVSQTSFPQL